MLAWLANEVITFAMWVVIWGVFFWFFDVKITRRKRHRSRDDAA